MANSAKIRQRVVHLTSVHVAEDTRIAHKECRALAEAGYEVVLIAASDRIPTIEGVEVRALPVPRSRLDRVVRTIPRVFAAAVEARGDLYHIHDPELLPMAGMLKALGKRVIYDAHEDVPKQVLAKPYISPALKRVLPSIVDVTERGIASRLDGVITATERVAAKFPRDTTAAIHNFPMLDEFDDEPVPYSKRANDMAYVGALDETRGLAEMLAIAEIIGPRTGASLVLAGPARAEVQARHPDLLHGSHVQWRGRQNRREVSELLQAVKIGLCVLHPTPAYVEALPTKVLEYMACGMAVVASDFPYWRELFGDAAVYVDPLDTAAAAETIVELMSDDARASTLASKGVALARSRYNWKVEAAKLVAFYRRCLAA